MKRKLSVILALDMADRVSEAETPGDQADLIERLRLAASVIITRHDGRIFNEAGACTFADFSSSVEAMRCAVVLITELNAAQGVRIGLTLGDVIETEGNLLGDAVNIAARLAAVAEQQAIVVGATVHDQVRAKFTLPFILQPALMLKNIAQPFAAIAYYPLDPDRRAPEVETSTVRRYHVPLIAALVLGGVAIMTSTIWWRTQPSAGPTAGPSVGGATTAETPTVPASIAASAADRAKRLAGCADILDRVQSGAATVDDRKALQACR